MSNQNKNLAVISKAAREIIAKRLKKEEAKANAELKKDLKVSSTKRELKQDVSDAVAYKNKMERGRKQLQEALEKQRKKETTDRKADERVETIGKRKGGRSQREGRVVGNRIKFFKFNEKNKLKK